MTVCCLIRLIDESACSASAVDTSDLHFELGQPWADLCDGVNVTEQLENLAIPGASAAHRLITPVATSVSRSQAADARADAAVGRSVPGFVLAAFPGSASNYQRQNLQHRPAHHRLLRPRQESPLPRRLSRQSLPLSRLRPECLFRAC